MPRLLVFQHVAHEILGTLQPLLRSHGFRIRYVNFGRHPDAQPSIEGYHGLVVLGGPMNVDETAAYPHIATEIRLLEAIAINEHQLQRAIGASVGYGHADRTHLRLEKRPPEERPIEPRALGEILAIPRIDGLHHRHSRELRRAAPNVGLD